MQSDVVGNISDNSNSNRLIFASVLDDTGQTKRISSKPALVESFVDDSVEVAISSPLEERVKSNKRFEVEIARASLADASVGGSAASDQVDTHGN